KYLSTILEMTNGMGLPPCFASTGHRIKMKLPPYGREFFSVPRNDKAVAYLNKLFLIVQTHIRTYQKANIRSITFLAGHLGVTYIQIRKKLKSFFVYLILK